MLGFGLRLGPGLGLGLGLGLGVETDLAGQLEVERDAAGGYAVGGGCDAPVLEEDAHVHPAQRWRPEARAGWRATLAARLPPSKLGLGLV